MANETLISKLVDLVGDITKLGGQRERTTIVPNILVVDATPSDLPTGYIKIRNPRDGTNVPCLTVNGLIVADNDLVNVLFTEGTEPIALTQGSQSPSSNIKVYQLWESDFGAVAWQTNAGGNLANVNGETFTLNDSTPTIRTLLSPGTPTTAAVFTSYDEVGDARFIIASGTDAAAASTIQLFDQAGETRFFMDSDGNLVGRDDGGNARIDWDTGTAVTDTTLTLLDTVGDKIILSSNGNILISDDLVHLGDPDTLRSFTDDAIADQAGGVVMLRLTETTQNLVEIGDVAGTGDVDVNINAGQVFVEGGRVFLNDTANTQMTIGLTINQGAADNEILALKSSDVAHGMTAITETDTYLRAMKVGGAVGGVILDGLTESNVAYLMRGNVTTGDTTKSTAGLGPVVFIGRLKSGTSAGAMGANDNIFVVRDNVSTRFIVDAEGDIHYDGTNNPGAWDSEDDTHILRALSLAVSDPATVIKNEFDGFIKYHKNDLIELGVLSDGGFVNLTQVVRVMIGALWQQNIKIKELEGKLS